MGFVVVVIYFLKSTLLANTVYKCLSFNCMVLIFTNVQAFLTNTTTIKMKDIFSAPEGFLMFLPSHLCHHHSYLRQLQFCFLSVYVTEILNTADQWFLLFYWCIAFCFVDIFSLSIYLSLDIQVVTDFGLLEINLFLNICIEVFVWT